MKPDPDPRLLAFHASRSVAHQPFRSACYAPFVGMSFDPSGTVSVCGFTRSTPLGVVGTVPLVDMWTGSRAAALRRAVRDDQLEGGCRRCAAEIGRGNLHGALAVGFDPFPASEHAAWPGRMEFALSNRCNLACVMCSGEFSSTIRSKRERLPPIPRVYGDRFVGELRPFLPHLRQARFLGGEPFGEDINFRIWDELIAAGANVECNVTTNGTVWTPRVQRALEALPFTIGVSLDGVKRETIERIRSGADYVTLMANLDRFVAYSEQRGVICNLTFCLMTENWSEFGEFCRFADDRGCTVSVNTVHHPRTLSLYRLPTAHLAEVVDSLESRNDDLVGTLRLNRQVWVEQVAALRHHLEQRRSAGEERVHLGSAGAVRGGFGDVIGRVLVAFGAGGPRDSGAAEVAEQGRVIEALGVAAGSPEVSVLVIDATGRVDGTRSADTFLGIELAPFDGALPAALSAAVAERFGGVVELADEALGTDRDGSGVQVRVVSYEATSGAVTPILVVNTRGSGDTLVRFAAILRPAGH